MLINKWTVTLLLLSLTACSQDTQKGGSNDINTPSSVAPNSSIAGITFIEEVTAQAGKTAIPYQKYVLDNGLTVILHEDNSDPLVHVDVTYHVGSGREDIGKSGFAHFFEHMMFQGSEHVADEQHFKIVTEAGGTMNGSTSSDRTNYYQTVPSNQFEKMLWLEADRMGFLVDAVTQDKFEVQRETVKNERGQRIDNRPYGRLNERVAEALYPLNHPYSWPVIGHMEDLNRVNVNDLKAFFLRWYGPNNATITIGGDIDIQQSLALVKKYFASIPKGPEVKMPEKVAFTLESDRYISMEDNIHLPLVYLSYPTVSLRHEDEAPLDLLSTILGGGKTSLLYKNLVKNQLAVQTSVSHPCAELSCTFNLYAMPNPASGKSLADLEKIIRSTLVEFETRGVEDDDLIKAKAEMEASFIFGLQSVSGKVGQLASNETFTGNPNYIEQDILRYANVTKADVMRVYNQYIKNKHAVIMSIVPNGQLEKIAAADNFTPSARIIPDSEVIADADLHIRKAVDDFDRKIVPSAGEAKAVTLPEMWEHQLANGMKILATQSLETPTTSLLLKIPAGHYYNAKNKAGLASLLAEMLDESTTIRSAENMSKALQKLGSSAQLSASNQYLEIKVNALTKNLDETLALVHEKIMQPAFLESEFKRNKDIVLQGIINNKKDAGYLASSAYQQLLHADNIAGIHVDGTEQSVENITLADIKTFYKQQVKPHNSQVIAVSDLDKNTVLKTLSRFESWEGQGKPLTSVMTIPLANHNSKLGVIYLVNKDKAAQSTIYIGKRSLPYDTVGEYYQTYLMNFPLGDAFNSRINLNLRENKGYTYGAGSWFSADKLSGRFTARSEVRADVTDKAIVEFVNEITHYAEAGITDQELSFMRNAINQKDALKYETPYAKLGFLAKILEFELSADFVKQRATEVDNITKTEINALAKKHLNIADMLMVVVGDAATLKPQLKALGYEVIDYGESH